MAHKRILYLLIIILSIICLSGLYYFAGNADSFNYEPVNPVSSNIIENSKSFAFDPEILTYDGQGELDYLSGVTYKGGAVPDNISYSIQNSESIDTKTIIYRVQNEDNVETASRTLKLENYHPPKIIIPDPVFSIEKENIDELYSIIDYEEVSVDNGFGQEDKSKLKYEYEWDSKDSAQINYTLSYINPCGDIATSSFSTEIKDYTFRIVLKQSKVVIKRYDKFNPKKYLYSCKNSENVDYTNKVEIYDDVNMSKKGTYIVTYKIEDITMKMIVVVS